MQYIYLESFSHFFRAKKDKDFLSEKPSAALSTIATLQDAELLLNNELIFNTEYPSVGVLSSDEAYTTYSNFLGASTNERNAYTWENNIYPLGAPDGDWSSQYNKVYYANIVLDAMKEMNVKPSEQSLFNELKGRALMFRAFAFFSLMPLFTSPYNSSAASTQPGICLRLTSDINESSSRASQASLL